MAHWTIVVIGGGAAGLSAAAAAAGLGQSCLVIDRMGGGGELMNLGALHGIDDDLTGPDLMAQLLDGAVSAGAELAVAEVTGLTPVPEGWRITTDDETHTAQAVVLAVGLAPGTLGLDNEAAFEGQGLSYCAACDGPLYRGQSVIVAGSDRWARHEAEELAAMACQVTLVTENETTSAIQDVTVIEGRITALDGTSGLDAITIQAGNDTRRLETAIVFVQTGRRPALDFIPAELARDTTGRLMVDHTLQCGMPGIFAVGDCRSGSARTLAAAMEDGRRAVAAILPLGKSTN